MPNQFTFPGAQLGSQLATRRGLDARRLRIGIAESRPAEVLERFHLERARKAAKKAQKKSRGLGGLIGTGAGAAVGALVPGAGVATIGLGASLGGIFGSALDPGSVNPGPGVLSALNNLVRFDDYWGSGADFAIQRMGAPVRSTQDSLAALNRPVNRFPALPKASSFGDLRDTLPLPLPIRGALPLPLPTGVTP